MKFVAAILFLLIFLPILLTLLLSGKKTFKFTQEREMEQLLATMVYREIPDDCQVDMICAQAVLVRSRVWLECEETESQKEVYKRILGENVKYERSHNLDSEKLSQCKEAVQKTEGCMLGYGGQVVEGPFCRASNGWTRGGKEVLGKDSYGWIVGVESKADLDYEADRKPMAFTEDELYEKLTGNIGVENVDNDSENSAEVDNTIRDGNTELEDGDNIIGQIKKEGILDSISVVTADSAGYAIEVSVGEVRMSGESFRQALGLPSASFTLVKEKNQLLFTCRGMGHGMGLSQYGADVMAEEGKSWRDILNYYFPNAQIIKEEKKSEHT